MKQLLLVFSLLTLCSLGANLGADNATLFTEHYKMLKHTQEAKAPLVVCFSAIPGMGKSYIAKQLEERYKAVRISTDSLRDLIRKTDANALREEALDSYLNYFFAHYTAPNRFFILDASIDRRIDQLSRLLEARKIPLLVIRLDVPFEDAKERIIEREKEDAPNYLKYMASWQNDYEAFHYPAAIIVKNGKADTLNLEPVFECIDALQK